MLCLGNTELKQFKKKMFGFSMDNINLEFK